MAETHDAAEETVTEETMKALSGLSDRRLLFRALLGGCLGVAALAVAGCGPRRDLPPERRTRGRYGHRGD